MPGTTASPTQDVVYLRLRCLPELASFRQEAEYASCRERLVELLSRNRGALLDYCLTTSEIRLAVRLLAGQTPGRFVQELSGWLRTLNRRDGRGSHVLAERTRSVPIDNADAFRRIVCWLARFPWTRAWS